MDIQYTSPYGQGVGAVCDYCRASINCADGFYHCAESICNQFDSCKACIQKKNPVVIPTCIVNYQLLAQVVSIVAAYPHLTPVISESNISCKKPSFFAFWFSNRFASTFLEHKLNE